MKKILFCFCACILTLSIFAISKCGYSKWNCKNKAKLEQSLKVCAPSDVATLYVLIALVDNPVNTFDELCKLIDKIGKKYEYSQDQIILLKKQVPYYQNRFLKEAWAFCAANPTDFDYFYAQRYFKELNIDNEMRYKYAFIRAMYNDDTESVKEAINIMFNLADSLEEYQVKMYLKRLNRKLSRNLFIDKAKWEPIIFIIRNELEKY